MKKKEEEGLTAAYDFWNEAVCEQREKAMVGCRRIRLLEAHGASEREISDAVVRLFGGAGSDPYVCHGFLCENGKNIQVGDDFLAGFNVTVLDAAPVIIGNHVIIGPNTLITTIGYPLSPSRRRELDGTAEPIVIGDDVWIGGNVTILPGVTIGNNVVIAAGAVVTRAVGDNCVVSGVPAKEVKEVEFDIEPEESVREILPVLVLSALGILMILVVIMLLQ